VIVHVTKVLLFSFPIYGISFENCNKQIVIFAI
jgi:hypothetical protein